MVEILAPVGSKENLIASINAGADAVYLGLKDFSARKSADNFDFDELKYAVAYAKTFNVKVYVTVNTLIKNSEIDSVLSCINTAHCLGVDAFILQDVFLGKYVKKIMPNVNLHLSTQAGVCNVYGAIQAKKYGFSRVILARETKIEDVKKISEIIETEVFIQGALCTCFSGHCYFSSFVGGNSGNRGYCKQPCRKKYSYKLGDKTLKEGYVLSLSDLSLDADILNLIKLGVKSFKIEGRMRSKEYVASSVLYYKSIISNKLNQNAYNALKISFNRGDYTKGLAISQDKNLISSNIQNNKGLFVAKIKSLNKKYINFNGVNSYKKGDSFKILRNGFEVGNATTVLDGNCLKIAYSGNVKVGDSVHLTKKVDLYENLGLINKLKNVTVKVCAKIDKPLMLSVGNLSVESDFLVQKAISYITTKEDIINNLNKTDVYPYKVTVEFIDFDNDAFIVKSALNKLRAELYEKLFYEKNYKIPYNIEKYKINSKVEDSILKSKKAVIVSNVDSQYLHSDYVIYAPFNYNNLSLDRYPSNVYLYIPPYLSGKDLVIIKNIIDKFSGIYADGVWAIEFAKENNLKLFAGCGFNVFNSLDVDALKTEGITEIALSKELSRNEIDQFNNDLFVLSGGLIEIMDLIYCPFDKNCNNCIIEDKFELIDYENRRFFVKRYIISECRFKVFNLARLNNYNFNNKIIDLTLDLPDKSTSGNYVKGVK